MKTIKFTIQTSTEKISESAILVNSISEGKEEASSFFSQISEEEFKTNKLGEFDEYTIYENYIDSGSEDYFFFAILN